MSISKEDINKALNILLDISIDYGSRNAEEIKELDDAFDIVQMAAQGYANLGGDQYKTRAQKEVNKAYVRGYQDGRKSKGDYERGWADGCLTGYTAAEERQQGDPE